MCSRGFVVCLVVLCCGVYIEGFNLEQTDYAVHRGSSQSMFGFSVTSHSFSGQNWVIVGAPEAQTEFQSPQSVYRGGAVYFCPVDRDDGCREIPFDRNGNNNNSANHQIDEKSRQWFGATVNSGGPDKPIVACAPRYLWFTTKNDRRDPVGTCYVAQSDLTAYSEFSPCRTRHWGYHRQGTCQAGLGAAISKNGERLFIGAPGSWYWQGQMYSIDPEARFLYTPPMFSDFGAGQLYSQHLRKRPSVFFTKEGEQRDDDSYMGYSVTSGNFTGDADGGLAAGMPRGNRLKGKVLIYSWNLTNHQNVSGSQLGAYFGYAIAAADMNGDGLDDLIVGAPLHTEPNNEGKYDVGRVYVIYPEKDSANPKAYPRLRHFDTRDGVNTKGRFGLSVACLGDLDLDGYQDIAIGAPYDGPHERGAVYIYYGSKSGIRKKVSQVIFAEDLGQGPLYTFGFSVSGNGIDLDRNQYPDLVVGAYLSNKAFIFRSRPVINVEGNVEFGALQKQISLDERNCSLSREKYVSCTSLKACVRYNGVGVNNNIDLILDFVLDAKNTKDPRMFLYPYDRRHKFNETWSLRRNDEQCKIMQVYIKDNTRDKLTPLEVEMSYKLVERQRRDTQINRRNPRNDLQPIVNGNLPGSFKDSIRIKTNCGEDDVCIPDLRLVVTPDVEKYLLGSGKRLKIDVKVMNEGEDSFESMFYMKVPPGINYFNTEQIDGPQVKCSAPSDSEETNRTLKCDIGNPLPALKMVHFKVLLDPFKVEGMKASYDFSMKINSTNPEDNSTLKNNVKDLSVEIWVKTNISLTGWAQYPDIHYKENTYKSENFTHEVEIGPQIVHTYNIKNNGPSDINEAEVIFMWPSQTLEGDDLLYLMEQPEVQGKITCEFVREANPLKVDLAPKKYYLDASSKEEASKWSGSHIASEEKSTSNTAATGANKHDEKKIQHEDKLAESGDGSLVHEDRSKEGNKAERTQGQSSGSFGTSTGQSAGGVYKEEQHFRWNSSSVNGGPVQTWSRNSTSTTGHDGRTHFSESSSNNQGQNTDNINNYNIIYTSTGNQQGNQFENGQNHQTNTDQSYSISQNSNMGHYDVNHGQHGHSGHKDEYYGTVQTTGQKDSKKTGYFNWDGVSSQDSATTENNFGVVHTHSGQSGQFGQSSNSGSITGDGELVYTNGSGTISGSGEMVFQNSGSGTVYQEFKRISGYDVTSLIGEEALRRMINSKHGEFNNGTHNIKWSTNNGRFRIETVYQDDSKSVYKDFKQISGYDVTNLIDEDTLRRMINSKHGEFNNGTHNIKWSTQNNRFRIETVYQDDNKSVYKDFKQISGYDVTNLIDEDTLRRMINSKHGEFNNGTHNIKWSTHNNRFRIETVYQDDNKSVYKDFKQISGYDVSNLIGEEALRRMINSQHGEFNNGTHNIKWSTHNGRFRIETVHQNEGDSVYTEFRRLSGYDLRGQISEDDLRKMIESGSGEFYNGTHRIKWSTETHHGGHQTTNQQRGSIYSNFKQVTGYDLTGLINEDELRRMIQTGHVEYNNGTHRIGWTNQNGEFRMHIGSNYQSKGAVFEDFKRFSGYDLTYLINEDDLRKMVHSGHGEFNNGTHIIRWTKQDGRFNAQITQQSRGALYNEFRRLSGYDMSGLMNEDDLRRMMQAGYGEYNNGTHVIRWTKQNGRFTSQTYNTQQNRGVYTEFRRLSGYDLSGLMSEDDLRRMIQLGHGEYNNGTHLIRWSRQNGRFTATITTTHQHRGGVYNDFKRISGYDLTGLISEEDLQRMINSRSGEFSNGTHRIKWNTKHGDFRIDSDSSRPPFVFSTEESVNQNIDEYTNRHITQGGRGQSSRDRSTYGQYDQSGFDTSAGIGGAAIGGGLRTTGLDLGTLNANNDHSHSQASYYDPDLGSYEDRSSEGHSGVSYGTSRAYSGQRQGQHESQYSGQRQGQHESQYSGQRQGHSEHESHSSRSYYNSEHGSRNFVGDNVPTDHPLDTDYRNRLYRNKRQVDDDISKIIQCKSTKCSVIRCKSGPLVKDEEAWAALRFRANAATLKKIGWTNVVTVSSMMVSRINKLPYIGTPLERPIHTHEVFTNVTLTETEIKPDVVPLWVVVLSACAGALILLLLIFLLYKCGFFERNRPSDAPERQPLNRNGHYNGDEQL